MARITMLNGIGPVCMRVVLCGSVHAPGVWSSDLSCTPV